jgi:5'-3' exonuclease
LPRLLDALGVPCFVAPGFEADDVLATLARELRSSNTAFDVRIVTTDRDLFQVVRDGVDVLFVGARGQKPTLYDDHALAARYRLAPTQLPSLTALVGDTADNLPKIPGVGASTAQKLVQRFGDMRHLVDGLGQVTPVTLRATLAAASAQVLETESLARLRDDVPLPPGPRVAPVGAEAWSRVRALFIEWEFGSLLARVDRLSESAGATAAEPTGTSR